MDLLMPLAPHPRLRRYISHYWLSRNSSAGDHRILPDGCVDLVLAAGHDLTVTAYGSTTAPGTARVQAGHHYLGIRFHPGQHRHFLPLPAAELRDRALPLPDNRGLIATLGSQVFTHPHPCRILDQLLLDWLGHYPAETDALDHWLLHAPWKSGIASVCHAFGVSKRQLQRQFQQRLGISPGTFLTIRRCQWLIRTLTQEGVPPLAALAQDAGFSDQSHMTRTLKRVMGVTPAAAILPDHDVAFIQDAMRAAP